VSRVDSPKTYVIVPCFNEENRLETDYWNRIIGENDFTWVFVDDGSRDQTTKKLSEIKNIKVLRLEKNSGKGEALRFGTNYVFGINSDEEIYVAYLDADGAFKSQDIKRIFSIFEEKITTGLFQSVWASRVALSGRKITRSLVRHYLSRAIISIVGFTDKNLPYDSQTGFKIFLINSDSRLIFKDKFKTRWFFELEIRNRWEKLKQNKLSIWEEPLDYWKDIGGSKVNGKQVFRILVELLIVLRMNTRK
jgi:glycosyltransferase involved in cell wall biosynthesis